MRVLLDECVNPRLRTVLQGHEVFTVAEADWRAVQDADLVRNAQGRCDVFITLDKGFEHEHNLKGLTFGIVIVHVPRNRMQHYHPLVPALQRAIEQAGPGMVIHVPGHSSP